MNGTPERHRHCPAERSTPQPSSYALALTAADTPYAHCSSRWCTVGPAVGLAYIAVLGGIVAARVPVACPPRRTREWLQASSRCSHTQRCGSFDLHSIGGRAGACEVAAYFLAYTPQLGEMERGQGCACQTKTVVV